MMAQSIPHESVDFQRIAQAIHYIHTNFKTQPSLEEVAEKVHLSAFHFQRLFTEWAGISPKKYLQYTSLHFAKSLMTGGNYSISKTAYETGLSGSSRLYDLFVNIEGITPGEYKEQGANIFITYGFAGSPFGPVMIATTPRGICKLSFYNDENAILQELKDEWPKSQMTRNDEESAQFASAIFSQKKSSPIKLNVKGTSFQLKVWEALLSIPEGKIAAYNQVADLVGQSSASRAVGSAIGKNPVALLIPCHRVIKKVGGIGEYRWNSDRKLSLLSWEMCQTVNRENIQDQVETY